MNIWEFLKNTTKLSLTIDSEINGGEGKLSVKTEIKENSIIFKEEGEFFFENNSGLTMKNSFIWEKVEDQLTLSYNRVSGKVKLFTLSLKDKKVLTLENNHKCNLDYYKLESFSFKDSRLKMIISINGPKKKSILYYEYI